MIKKRLLSAALLLSTLAGCGSSKSDIPEWQWKDNSETTDSTSTVTEKPRYVWIDASGNFEQYANSQENIKSDLQKIKETGFTDVIVDVRPTTGDVLFKSSVADALTKIDVWRGSQYLFVERTATWDYLQTFIDEGHKLGLKVNASINTFVGGYLCPYNLGTIGMLYRDSSKKGWAEVLNTASGLVNELDYTDSDDYGARFLNPANDDVQNYILNILGDLAKYDLDGIILDRCRYGDFNLQSDFSDESRTKFESFIGQKVTNFPADILPAGTTNYPDYKTTWYKKWYAFRAKVIHDFIVKAKAKVKSVNKDIRFGAYVGAWYSTYYRVGVNWASPKYDPSKVSDYTNWSANSDWASAEYKNYGYADELDFIFLGAYASASNIYGSGEWTMQGFCQQGRELLKGDVTFAGGADIGNPSGWADGGQASKIPDAIDACISNSDGFFAFDVCHIRKYDYWSAFKKGFDKYLNSIKK